MNEGLGHEDSSGASKQVGSREVLTRVLAIEGRNALARVELAASELSRIEATPATRARVETIRNAAAELEGLLTKIDLLSTPRSMIHWPALVIEDAFRRVEVRIASTLRARRATLVWRADPSGPPATLELPEATLERFLVALVRLGLNLSGGEGEFILEAEAARDGAGEDDLISIVLQLPPNRDRSSSVLSNREARVDLDVQLAEWGGLCVVEEDAPATRVVLSLPSEAVHAL